MSETLPYPIPHRRLWFAFLAGPVSYFVQLLVGLILVPVACRASWVPLFVLDLLALLVTLVAVVTAYRDAQALSENETVLASNPGKVAHFLSGSALALGLVFGLLIILTSLPTLLVSPCRPW